MSNDNEFPTRLLFAGFVHSVERSEHGIDLIGYLSMIDAIRLEGQREGWTTPEMQLAVMVLADEGEHHLQVTHTEHPTWSADPDFTIDMHEHAYRYVQVIKGEFPVMTGDEAYLNEFQIRLDGASIGHAYVLGHAM